MDCVSRNAASSKAINAAPHLVRVATGSAPVACS